MIARRLEQPTRRLFTPLATLAVIFLSSAPVLMATADPSLREEGIHAPSEKPTVSNLFFQTPLTDALADVSAQTGAIIVTDPSVQGLVTCELEDVPLEQALDILLAGGGFVYRKMEGYILVGSALPDSPLFNALCDTRIVRLNYLMSDQALQLLPKSLAKYVSAPKETHTLTIMAPPAEVERIEAELRRLDRTPPQIILDAQIVVMESADLSDLGLQWSWPVALAGGFTDSENWYDPPSGAPRVPWGVQFGYTPKKEFTNALSLTLNLLTTNDEAVVLASPKVMVQEGQEAEVNVGTEEYFEILTRGYYTSSELEKIEAGIILRITPRITEDQSIILDMATEVSDVVARGENNLPVVTRRKATSSVRVEDGGTAAVAGLNDRRYRKNLQRVPFFWRLPLAGRLFQSEEAQGSERQVVVFITAHIMDESETGIQERFGRPPRIERVGADFKLELIEALEEMGAL